MVKELPADMACCTVTQHLEAVVEVVALYDQETQPQLAAAPYTVADAVEMDFHQVLQGHQ
jgi:hypothetical protein